MHARMLARHACQLNKGFFLVPQQLLLRSPANWQTGLPRAAMSSNVGSMELQNSSARTQVFDKVSPPALVEAKVAELANIGPSGWHKLLLYRVVSLPIWVTAGAQLLAKYVTRPGDLFRAGDPNAFKLVPPFHLHEEFIDVNGIKLHAVSPGRRQPDKPLLLMLHGFPECWYSWRYQMVALASDYDVVALDMRGYNTSNKPQGKQQYHLHQLVADVKGAVPALGHKTCTLMAHDWGGVVAWAVAGLYGRNLVDKLVVMGLPHLGVAMTNYTKQQYMRQLYMLLFQAPGLPEVILTANNAASMQDIFFHGKTSGVKNKAAMSPADVDWFRAAILQPGAATAALNYYRSFVDFTTVSDPQDPVWKALRQRLDIPTLVLHGDSDSALGTELLDGIEAAVPQVTVKVLENCSHWVQQDYPQQVNEIVQDWLSKK